MSAEPVPLTPEQVAVLDEPGAITVEVSATAPDTVILHIGQMVFTFDAASPVARQQADVLRRVQVAAERAHWLLSDPDHRTPTAIAAPWDPPRPAPSVAP